MSNYVITTTAGRILAAIKADSPEEALADAKNIAHRRLSRDYENFMDVARYMTAYDDVIVKKL